VFPAFRATAAAALAGALGLAPAQTAASRFALAIATEPRGRALVDVGPDDFVVEEGGQAREILDVRVADYPLAIVVDNGAAARAAFPDIRKAVGRFVARLGPRPIALVSTARQPAIAASFADERATVTERLDTLPAPSDDEGRPLDAAAVAADAIRQTGALFSALVVVAASPIDAGPEAATPSIAAIVDSRAVVHVVAQGRGEPGATGSLPRRPDRLRDLVDQTRGEYLTIYSPVSYQPALDRIADRLTTELVIEYLVPVGSHASDPKIGIRIPGARVRGLGVAPR
jgi:hypothetical protein